MVKKVGLALGSGGARGWAHIGAIRALEAAGVKLEETSIPFHCVATDLLTQKAVILKSGLMVDAVRASISIPGVFTPFNKEETYLIDGGVINPVPVDVVRDMGSDIVIAINLNHPDPVPDLEDSELEEIEVEVEAKNQELLSAMKEETEETNQVNRLELLNNLKLRYEAAQEILAEKVNNWLPDESESEVKTPNIFDVIGSAINIMEQQVTQINLQVHQPDILLQPRLFQYGIFDFHQAETLMKEGYRCVQDALPEIQEKLQ